VAIEVETGTGTVETAPSRLSWSAIFGGTFAALGLGVLLAALGIALGFGAIDPRHPNFGRVSWWLGLWSLVVPLPSMFLGTLVATRAAGALRRGTGILYGVVVWGLTTFVGGIVAVTIAGALVVRAANAALRVLAGAGPAVASLLDEVGLQSSARIAQTAVLSALLKVGHAFWWIFGSVVLGLAAALLSGWWAATKLHADHPTLVRPTAPAPPPPIEPAGAGI
jgi:hypothetical protein